VENIVNPTNPNRNRNGNQYNAVSRYLNNIFRDFIQVFKEFHKYKSPKKRMAKNGNLPAFFGYRSRIIR